MTFLKHKGKYLTLEGDLVDILSIRRAIRFEYYITAAQKKPKLEKLIGDLELVDSMEIIKELLEMKREEKDQIYEGGLVEHRDRVVELLKENEELKEEIKKLRKYIEYNFRQD